MKYVCASWKGNFSCRKNGEIWGSSSLHHPDKLVGKELCIFNNLELYSL